MRFLQRALKLISSCFEFPIDSFKLLFSRVNGYYDSHFYLMPGGDETERYGRCRSLIYMLNTSGQCIAETIDGLSVSYAQHSLYQTYYSGDRSTRNCIIDQQTIWFDDEDLARRFYGYQAQLGDNDLRGRKGLDAQSYVNSKVLRLDYPMFDCLCPLTWPGHEQLYGENLCFKKYFDSVFYVYVKEVAGGRAWLRLRLDECELAIQ